MDKIKISKCCRGDFYFDSSIYAPASCLTTDRRSRKSGYAALFSFAFFLASVQPLENGQTRLRSDQPRKKKADAAVSGVVAHAGSVEMKNPDGIVDFFRISNIEA
jgi:hypothetical protein